MSQSKFWAFYVLFGAFIVFSMQRVIEAVPLPAVDAADAAQKKPVVAPFPQGVDPSSPSVAGEPVAEVLTSTPTPKTTTNNSGGY